MPTICTFRGIKICIYWSDHLPPHFHAFYGGDEVLVSINEIEVLEGSMPSKQLKMLLGCVPSGRTQGKLGVSQTEAGTFCNRAA